MRNCLLFAVAVVASAVWFCDWSSSGRMDNFIERHSDPRFTPKLLSLIAGVYQTTQDSRAAAHYYRWIAEKYPDSMDIDRVRYRLAECYEDNHMRQEAMEQYTILKDSFSKTQYGRLGQAKYDRTRF
jgi:hypothetical protein